MARYRRFDTARAGTMTAMDVTVPDAIAGVRLRRAGLRSAMSSLEVALAAPAPRRVDEWRFGVTITVRPRQSNGSPLQAWSNTSTCSSRIRPRAAWSIPAMSNSSMRYPAPTTTHSLPGDALSRTAICSATRTGSCRGRTAALTITRARSVRPSTTPAIVSGAGNHPSSMP